MDIRILAEMTREPPREWVEELRRVSPKTTAFSYLEFKWEFVLGRVRGVWRDRSRWVLYQMQPAWAIPPGIRAMLEDVPPRLLPPGRAHARRAFVDDWAHEKYRTERVFPRPFWVIQGPNGGVPAGYSDIEAAILQAIGEPTNPPPVGFLPYANFDARVIQQVLMRDKLLAAGMDVEEIAESTKLLNVFRDEADEAAHQFRLEFLDWFKGTLAPGADWLTWFTRRTEADRMLRAATRAEAHAALALEETFLETGELPAEVA